MATAEKESSATAGVEPRNSEDALLEKARAAALETLFSNVGEASENAKDEGNASATNADDYSARSAQQAKAHKKAKKRRSHRRSNRPKNESQGGKAESDGGVEEKDDNGNEDDVRVDYVPETYAELNGNGSDEVLEQFKSVLEKFQTLGSAGAKAQLSNAADDAEATETNKPSESNGKTKSGEQGGDDAGSRSSDSGENDDEAAKTHLSRRQRKLLERLSVADLKRTVKRAEVVEQWDVTAADPELLVSLKAYRNTVPVPTHWRQKRKYLQNKRGMYKQPFQLPAFIAETGIQNMREAYAASDDNKSLKQKQREKIRPKTGRADIDYQILHDAFFKFQTKPHLTSQGDLYYELRELEVKKKNFKPGVISEPLRVALGMASADEPPPWLYNMQRFPPPPSYPQLKIPGFNAPIPPGASFGYFPGGWGRPPVDAMNRPLYGDVFGMGWQLDERDAEFALPEEDKAVRWGEPGEDVESEEDDEGDEEDVDAEGENGLEGGEGDAHGTSSDVTSADTAAGIESTVSNLPGGVETPAAAIELRKGVSAPPVGSAQPPLQPAPPLPPPAPLANAAPRSLYTVLEEKKTNVGNAFMGTKHVYDVGSAKRAGEGVEVNINPEELEAGLDSGTLQRKFEQRQQAESVSSQKEDVGDIVAEGLARKRKEMERDKERRAKKAKELKF